MLHGKFGTAAFLLIISAIIDFFDGKIARKVGPTSYGHFLDLADLASFGVAPALFIILWLNPSFSPGGIIIYAAAFSLFIAGLLRLARFFTLGAAPFIMGLPITFNGIAIPFLWFVHANTFEVVVITFALCYMMLSTIKFKKKQRQ
jgi:CDP-diacylglycerol--serine O-phosphatidyltransferase